MYYIYALIDPRNNLPFYIGKGSMRKKRHLDHFNESLDTTTNRHKTFKILHLQSLNYEIPVQILDENIESELEAYHIETEYIKKFGRANIDENGILTNICLDHWPPNQKGKKQSLQHVQKRISSSLDTIRKNGRKPLSAEQRQKKSKPGALNPFFGKHHTIETKNAHSVRMMGNQNNAKKYLLISPDGQQHLVIGLTEFCKNNGLSKSTIEKILYQKKVITRGKCKGWVVKKIYDTTKGETENDNAE